MFQAALTRRVRLQDIVPDGVAITAICQITENHRVDGYRKRVDTAVPQHELTDTRMPATEIVATNLVVGPPGEGYVDAGGPPQAGVVVSVVDGGVVRTLIGTGELGDALEGLALQVGLNHPTNISFDPRGRLIMAAWHNSKVMRYDFSSGRIERICGNGPTRFRLPPMVNYWHV